MTHMIPRLLFILLAGLPLAVLRADLVVDAFADTYVDPDTPDTPQGGGIAMRVRNDSASGSASAADNWAIIRFDITSFSDPLASASLAITQWIRIGTYSVYGVADGGVDEFFDESLYTYNNATYASPTLDGSLNTAHSDLSLLGTFTTTADGVRATFTSPALTSFVGSDANNMITLILADAGSSNADHLFWAKERAPTEIPPQLSLVSIPEPSSAVLLMLGLGATAWSFSRKR